MKRMNNSQKGFTIIELVVVILLLGILTATALPRFINVTNNAHTAVVDAVAGGIGTGAALFKAQWFASNQPNTVTTEYNMNAYNTTGYPLGGNLGTVAKSMVTSSHCADLFRGILQPAGQPTITSKVAAAAALTTVRTVTGSTADFVAYLNTTSTTTAKTCTYVYTGQFTSTSLSALPTIVYNAATGAVTRGTLPLVP